MTQNRKFKGFVVALGTILLLVGVENLGMKVNAMAYDSIVYLSALYMGANVGSKIANAFNYKKGGDK